MIRTLSMLLLVAVLSSPVALADDSGSDDAQNQGTENGPCSVYRENPSGGPFNRIMIDPDGCWRAWIQSIVDTGYSTYNEAHGG